MGNKDIGSGYYKVESSEKEKLIRYGITDEVLDSLTAVIPSSVLADEIRSRYKNAKRTRGRIRNIRQRLRPSGQGDHGISSSMPEFDGFAEDSGLTVTSDVHLPDGSIVSFRFRIPPALAQFQRSILRESISEPVGPTSETNEQD